MLESRDEMDEQSHAMLRMTVIYLSCSMVRYSTRSHLSASTFCLISNNNNNIRRNQRLAEFDAQRAQRRAEAADDDSDGEGGDADAERAAMIAGMSLNDGDDSGDDAGNAKKERKSKGLEGIIETENANRAPSAP